MTTDDRVQLEAQLIRHEGLKLKVYLDTLGIPTIGVGRNLRDRGISMATAMQMLAEDIDEIEIRLRQALPWFDRLDAVRQRALIDMGFMGLAKLLKFRRMLAALKAGEWERAAAEALDSKWAQQVGPRRSGTVARMLQTGIAPER
jgi:lysozyme